MLGNSIVLDLNKSLTADYGKQIQVVFNTVRSYKYLQKNDSIKILDICFMI